MSDVEQTDVVIIGGGIVGCAAAYYLARRDVDVILLEKGKIGGEQSSRAWGFVRVQRRDPAEIPLIIEANRIWQGLSEELEADIEWVQGGNMLLANDDQKLGEFVDWFDIAREYDVDTRMLTRRDVEDLVPGIEGPFIGGMYTPMDGQAEPGKTTDAFANAAREHGADIRDYSIAERIEVTGGAVSGVHTDTGEIRTPVVINAAGVHAAKIGRQVGLSLPQRVVRGTVAETTPVRPVTPICTWAPEVAFRQKRDGSFYISGGATSIYDVTMDSFRHLRAFLPNYMKNRDLFRIRVGWPLWEDFMHSLPGTEWQDHPFSSTVDIEPEPDRKTAVESIKGLVTLFPDLYGKVKIRRMWAGMIDATPDILPVISSVDEPEGFIFATGFSGHGFAFGPIAGRLLAEMITDGQPSMNIDAFRYSRFEEGDIAGPRSVV